MVIPVGKEKKENYFAQTKFYNRLLQTLMILQIIANCMIHLSKIVKVKHVLVYNDNVH